MNYFRKTWLRISYLGLSVKDLSLEQRTNVLANQVNALVLFSMLVFSIFLRVMRVYEGSNFGLGSLRVLLLLFLSLINFVFAYKKKHDALKISLIFLSPLIFFILPTILGFVEEESFFYYPIGIIAFSIIPQLFLTYTKHTFLYLFSLGFYFVLVLFMDVLLLVFGDQALAVKPIVSTIFPYYKIAQITIFLFFHIVIYHLKKMNFRFEDKLVLANSKLYHQASELRE